MWIDIQRSKSFKKNVSFVGIHISTCSAKISEQIYYVYEGQCLTVYLIIHYSDNYYCFL